ncbi:MAG: ribosome-associated translation inhibitor RaiA [Verrucomicrobia bacterium]|nr:MAG: ribosome-associated translation inhibitor RaiA [Verrucomicrobiota bacterium]
MDFPAGCPHLGAMKFILSTHNMSSNPAIEERIQHRIEKLEHLNGRALETRVTLEHDRTQAPERQFRCAVRLVVRGPDLFAEDVEEDPLKAVDLAFKKLEQQVRKLHGLKKARHQEAARAKEARKDNGV